MTQFRMKGAFHKLVVAGIAVIALLLTLLSLNVWDGNAGSSQDPAYRRNLRRLRALLAFRLKSLPQDLPIQPESSMQEMPQAGFSLSRNREKYSWFVMASGRHPHF